MNKVIVAIGAHPDDIELGCGGILKQHVNQDWRVYGLVLTRGESGGNSVRRCHEAEESAKSLGLTDLIFFDFPDTAVPADGKIVTRIEQLLKQLRPQAVYTHTLQDRHQDHRSAYQAVNTAARTVPGLFLYESPSTKTDFAPKVFYDITNTMPDKLEALGKFESQIEKGIVNIDAITLLASYWAMKSRHVNGYDQVQKRYMEAFEIDRMVMEEVMPAYRQPEVETLILRIENEYTGLPTEEPLQAAAYAAGDGPHAIEVPVPIVMRAAKG